MFTKEHVEAVSKRLREYEKALASKEFVLLEMCDVCETVPDVDDEDPCAGCLFNYYKDGSFCMTSKDGLVGARCRTKQQQRAQFRHLLGQLDKNGWSGDLPGEE